jgi:hypothetical protein
MRTTSSLDSAASAIFAAPLARDGDPEPIDIEETNANFTIEWKGHHRIEGAASSSSIGRPKQPEPSWDIRRGNCNTPRTAAEISNMFG